MNMTLKRSDYREDGIFGSLLDDQGSHYCFTLEHAYLQPDGSFAPKIPVGTYQCINGQHQLAGMTTPFQAFELQNVPGHTNILIHIGNFQDDSSGCILIGTTLLQPDGHRWMIGGSAPMFNKFMAMQSDQFTLTVE